MRNFFTHCKLDENPIQEGDNILAADLFDWERKEQDEAALKKLEKLYDRAEGNLTIQMDGTLPFSAEAQQAAQRILIHFSDTRDEYTAQMDEYLAGIWEIYLDYKEREKTAEADVLYELNGNIDAERRARVFSNLVESKEHHGLDAPILSSLHSDMIRYGQSQIGRYYAYMEGGDDNFAVMDEAARAAETSIKNCEASLSEQQEKGLVRGNTAIRQYAYDAKMDLLPKKKGDEGINAPLQSLVAIRNIQADEIVDLDRELSLLRDYLVPLQNEILGEYLTRGVPEDYDTADTEEKKRSFLEPMQEEARESVAEIEKYDTWTLERLAGQDEQKQFLNNQIDWAENIQSKLVNDDFLGYAEIVRQEYEDWLKRKRDSLASEEYSLPGGGSTGGGGTGVDPTGGTTGAVNGEPEDVGEEYTPSDPNPAHRAIYYDNEAKKALERDDIASYKRYKEMADREREEARITGEGSNAAGNTTSQTGNGSDTSGGSGTAGNNGSQSGSGGNAVESSNTARNTTSQSGNGRNRSGGSGHSAYRPNSWKNGTPNTGLNLRRNTTGTGSVTNGTSSVGTNTNTSGKDNNTSSTTGKKNKKNTTDQTNKKKNNKNKNKKMQMHPKKL
ncbi:MAG: hypothetical protein IJ679_05480, partial [Lachnospiraceae bacterium]|nr:hypothetical protein [Lachnospiraceae bacterium]